MGLSKVKSSLRWSFRDTVRKPHSYYRKLSHGQLLLCVSGFKRINDDYKERIQGLMVDNAYYVRKIAMLEKRIELMNGANHYRSFSQGLKSYKNKVKKLDKLMKVK